MSLGGGGGNNSYDAAYNARMAELAERTAEMSEDAFGVWNLGTDGKVGTLGSGRGLEIAQNTASQNLLPAQTGYEQAMLESKTGLLPAQTALETSKISAESSLIPLRTEYEQSGLNYGMKQNKYKSDLMDKFYASLGQNSEGKAVMGARADVAGAVSEAKSSSIRDRQRRGVAGGSGSYGLEGAKLQVGAMSTARENTRKQNLSEYTQGLTI